MADEKEIFLEISVHLTGFDRAELQATGMLDAYFACIMNRPVVAGQTAPQVAENAALFITEARTLLKESKGNEQRLARGIASRLMPSSAYNGLAQCIITLWYTGNWGNDVLSAQSYIQGLVWDVAEAHPPGAKQPGFGSWSIPPVS